MKSLEEQLVRYVLDTKERVINSGRWITTEVVEMYVRKSYRYLSKEDIELNRLRTCLDIASITIAEGLRGQGLFGTQILPLIKKINIWEAIFVESVINERLEKYLKNNGWTLHPTNCYPPSFFLVTKE